MKLNNIERVYVISALREIDEKKEIPKNRESTGYDLLYEGRKYPPKYVISKANKFANGEELQAEIFHTFDANEFLINLGFDIVPKIIFPAIDKNLSIDQLSEIYQNIDGGIYTDSPIDVPSSCNVIPANVKGDCKPMLVGIIIDRMDLEKRMPKILLSLIRCQHRQVLLAVAYWDASLWEDTWKELFKAVCEKVPGGAKVYRQIYDGLPERIL